MSDQDPDSFPVSDSAHKPIDLDLLRKYDRPAKLAIGTMLDTFPEFKSILRVDWEWTNAENYKDGDIRIIRLPETTPRQYIIIEVEVRAACHFDNLVSWRYPTLHVLQRKENTKAGIFIQLREPKKPEDYLAYKRFFCVRMDVALKSGTEKKWCISRENGVVKRRLDTFFIPSTEYAALCLMNRKKGILWRKPGMFCGSSFRDLWAPIES